MRESAGEEKAEAARITDDDGTDLEQTTAQDPPAATMNNFPHSKGQLPILRVLVPVMLSCAIAPLQAAEKKNEDQKAVNGISATKEERASSAPSVVENVQGGAQAGCKGADCHTAADNGWWQRLWTDPVATFTGALFLATAALIGTGFFQWREMRKSSERQLRAYISATPERIERRPADALHSTESWANASVQSGS